MKRQLCGVIVALTVVTTGCDTAFRRNENVEVKTTKIDIDKYGYEIESKREEKSEQENKQVEEDNNSDERIVILNKNGSFLDDASVTSLSYGDSMDYVANFEKIEPHEAHDDFLIYYRDIWNEKIRIIYEFSDDKLINVFYSFYDKQFTGDDYLNKYDELKIAMEDVFGKSDWNMEVNVGNISEDELGVTLENGKARYSDTWRLENGNTEIEVKEYDGEVFLILSFMKD